MLSNAIKFTAEGSVTVRLRGDREMGVVLEVIDTGLGPPLSRVLVELHDGVLTIESIFGRGTVATVRLPGKRVMGRADAA